MDGYRVTFEKINAKRSKLALTKFEQDSINWAWEYIKGADIRDGVLISSNEFELKKARRSVGGAFIVGAGLGVVGGCAFPVLLFMLLKFFG